MSAAFLPLYAQVKRMMVQRIGAEGWKPGDLLPNEFALAAEYRVSQGTVRKALLALEAERLIVRQQGRGTFVARHTRQQALFQFFRITDPAGRRLTPVSVPLSQRMAAATRAQAAALEVAAGAALHVITRVRRFGEDAPAIHEVVRVPAALMPGLRVTPGEAMPTELYVLYQELYGITIARASERLAAVAATPVEAARLEVAPGTPLLEITRVAFDVGGRPVELRVSRCETSGICYAAEVT